MVLRQIRLWQIRASRGTRLQTFNYRPESRVYIGNVRILWHFIAAARSRRPRQTVACSKVLPIAVIDLRFLDAAQLVNHCSAKIRRL